MARTAKTTSIYDKLAKNEQDIIETEKVIKRLKLERKELLAEKDDYEMRKIWSKIKEQNLNYNDVEKMIVQKSKALNNIDKSK